MQPVLLQPAFVLHRYAYRETSLLVELFTVDYGRVTVIAKGVRKPRSMMQGLLQPFISLLVSWTGKSELKTLTYVEANGAIKPLQGESLFAGFYLNELLVRLLQKWDTHPNLYKAYERTLTALQSTGLQPPILRSFEKYLLEELGYGLLPKTGTSLHNKILPNKYYRFVPDQGLIECDVTAVSAATIFSGKSLLAMMEEDWQDDESLQDAKRLIRFVLTPLLGAKPIHSRRLFIQPVEEDRNEE